MIEKTLDLFAELPADENSMLTQQRLEPNVIGEEVATSFKSDRFIPMEAKNADQLYPHVPSVHAVPGEKGNTHTSFVHRRLWLALNFPLLPLAPNIVLSARPAVVVEVDGNAQTVLAANVAARNMGITPGMHLNSAYALAGELEALKRDPLKEQQTLEQLATWALQYSSCVSIEAPDALLIEVRGSLRLFGGARALREKMFAQLQQMGVVATAAIAPTCLAALWLARSAGPYPHVRNLTILPRYLHKLPLSCLRWPQDACTVLQDLGLRTVGECLRLPRDGFARRLGFELLNELDRATGRAAEPRLQYVPHEVYKGHCAFEMEVANTSLLECLLEPLVDELQSFLRSRTAGIQSLKLLLRHRELEPTRLILRFVAPSNLKEHFSAVLHERLERLVLPAPVLAVRMCSGPLQGLDSSTVHEKLFGSDGRRAEEIPRLIEKLRARLGQEAVYALRLTEDHRPERGYRITTGFPRSGLRSAVRGLRPEKEVGKTPRRPLWLLSPPQSLLSKQGRPHLNGSLIFESGPERIEGGWWDNADIQRDYYIARDRSGVQLWIFCERGKWFLHGRFG